MKTLFINGSPNTNGFTYTLLQKMAENAEQEENVINLKDYSILPCIGCLGCINTNSCIRNDDWSKIASSNRSAPKTCLEWH